MVRVQRFFSQNLVLLFENNSPTCIFYYLVEPQCILSTVHQGRCIFPKEKFKEFVQDFHFPGKIFESKRLLFSKLKLRNEGKIRNISVQAVLFKNNQLSQIFGFQNSNQQQDLATSEPLEWVSATIRHSSGG